MGPRQVLPPQGGRRSYATLGVEDKVFDATEISGVVVGLDRRSRPITVGYAARTQSDSAAWGYNVDLSANTGSGRGNDLASYQTEDPRIDTVHWKALRGGISYAAPLAGSWLWSARAQFQYSPDVLISGEQFGLGGIGFVRGTRTDRPITGDKGVAASLEVTTPELSPARQLPPEHARRFQLQCGMGVHLVEVVKGVWQLGKDRRCGTAIHLTDVVPFEAVDEALRKRPAIPS